MQDARPDPPVCGRKGLPPTGTKLALIRYGVAAKWRGMVTTPWRSPYPVEVTFQTDGHYSSRALGSSLLPAFYYGTDKDSQEKRYDVYDVYANGEGVAWIKIVFSPGSTRQGEMRHISLNTDLTKLTFKFWATWGSTYGPIIFDLTCKIP